MAFTEMVAVPVALFIALLGLLLSYKRYFLRIAESSTATGPKSTVVLEPLRLILNQMLLRDGVHRALYWLGIRLLLRSEPHRICFGAFGALGLVVFVGQLLTGSGPIAASSPLIFNRMAD